MARKLTTTQKKMIDKWIEKNWNGPGSIYCSDQIPVGILNQIVLANDYETVYQDMDRYIGDEALKRTYG